MNDPKLRAAKDLEETVNTYADTLYRVCLAMLRDPFEAEDTVQELFLAYFRSDKLFESEEHKRAWLVRCAVNRCKNVISFRRRHGQISLDELQECTGVSLDTENRDILDALLKLPQKYRIVMTKTAYVDLRNPAVSMTIRIAAVSKENYRFLLHVSVCTNSIYRPQPQKESLIHPVLLKKSL